MRSLTQDELGLQIALYKLALSTVIINIDCIGSNNLISVRPCNGCG